MNTDEPGMLHLFHTFLPKAIELLNIFWQVFWLVLVAVFPFASPLYGVQTVTCGAENFLKLNSENGLTAAGTAPEWGRTRIYVLAFTSPDSLFIPYYGNQNIVVAKIINLE